MTTTLIDLIEQYGITAYVSVGASPEYAACWPNSSLYTVVLSRQDDEGEHYLAAHFHTQPWEDLRWMVVHELLDAMLDEASSVEFDSYEAWCDEMNYEPEDEEDDAMRRDQYAQCKELLQKVQEFLGDKYNEFVYGVER
jgi:hypothetical protein